MDDKSAIEHLTDLFYWPSTSVSYLISKGDDQTDLDLTFAFDAKNYIGEQGQKLAEEHLLTYNQLVTDLQNRITMSLTVKLGDTTLSPAENIIDIEDFISQYLQPVITFLESGREDPSPAYCRTCALDMSGLDAVPEISELTATLMLTGFFALDDTSNRMYKASTELAVPPQMQTGNDGEISLGAFTAVAESALNSEPVTDTEYKIAYLQSAPWPRIWIVRFGTEGKGLYYKLSKLPVSYFAPLPLTEALQSFQLDINTYMSGEAYPSSSQTKMGFSGVDLDVWFADYLKAIDHFTVNYTTAAGMITGLPTSTNDDVVQTMTAIRNQIAESVSETVSPIIIEELSDNSMVRLNDPELAKETWKMKLQEALANKYQYVSLALQPMYVSSSPESAVIALLGPIKTSVPAGGYTIAPASISNQGAKSVLPVMVKAAEPGMLRNVQCNGLTFIPEQITFGNAPGQLPQTVTLADPHTSVILQTMGSIPEIEMPSPLRFLPQPVPLLEQVPEYPYADMLASDPMAGLRAWTYDLKYNTVAEAQDSVHINIQYNLPAAETFSEIERHLTKLQFAQALAQFTVAYPAILSDIEQYIPGMTPEKVKENGPAVKKARFALQAFTYLVKTVASSWTALPVAPAQTAIDQPQDAPGPSLRYTITESADLLTGALLIHLMPADPYAATLQPTINIPGYDRVAVDSHTTSYQIVGQDSSLLLYSKRQLMPDRRLSLPFDFKYIWNANGGAFVKRNDTLMQNIDLTWKKTNPLFVNASHTVTFPRKVTPLVESTMPVDINTLSTDRYGLGQRTINQQLLALFDALTAGIPEKADQYDVTVTCSYTQNLPGGGLPVSMPILFVPNYEVNVSSRGQDIANMLTSGITRWMDQMGISDNEGSIMLQLTLYSVTDIGVPVMKAPFFFLLSDTAK